MQRIVSLLACLFLIYLATTAFAQQDKRPLEISDLAKVKRISDPAVSPDGKWVVHTLGTASVAENKITTDLWLASIDGKVTRQLTTHPANDGSPVWSPDGKTVAFISARSGGSQIWLLSLAGGEPRQFTTLSTEADQPVWSPDGKSIAFISEVFSEFSTRPFAESDSLNKKKLNETQNGVVKARVFDRLFFRRWNTWWDGRVKHLFIQAIDGGSPRDLTPGERDAAPISSTFSGGVDFAFSPDGREIAFTSPPMPLREQAWNTNYDIFTVPVTGGPTKQLTDNPAADGYPRYSPDGKYIAYRAQAVPGFEADRWQLMLLDRSTGQHRSLTDNFDSHVDAPLWSPDGKTLFFTAEENGVIPIFGVSVAGNDVRKILDGKVNAGVRVTSDGKRLVFTQTSAVRPAEVFSVGTDGKLLAPVTRANDDLFAPIDIPVPESIWFDGDGGVKIQAWLFKPPKFDPAKKYPMVYLVHGGPQNSWDDSWHPRWNPAMWAAQGYVILAPNPRGSTGFGQKFTNEISGDWGGKVFRDLMKGVDYAETLPYVDKTRMAAAGASFGGYMMNWFLGNAGNRFRTIVTHASVYNFVSMYGSTDEVWFDEWDHSGKPWEKPEEYAKFSPSTFAGNFKTPTLVVHNERDFRVPLSEGLQLFTALQRNGVPSKFLYFPDEGHGVVKPANSEFWHHTVFDWLATYLK
jgi:dipeptidyl aminopeptidase/acylaminoacyl peptidase